jgi:hypothetical protein
MGPKQRALADGVRDDDASPWQSTLMKHDLKLED